MGSWDALRGLAAVVERHVPAVRHVQIGLTEVEPNRSELTAMVAFRAGMATGNMDDELTGMGVYQVAMGVYIETTAAEIAVGEMRIAEAVDQVMAMRRTGDATTLMGSVPRATWSDVSKHAGKDGESYEVTVDVTVTAAVRYDQARRST